MTSRFFGGFLGAAQFLTRVPIRLRDAPDLTASVPWFPVVGALIGAFVGAVAAGMMELVPAPVAAAVAVIVGVLLTGAFHEDGLADTADAMGGWTPERRREILKDSRHGSYGVAAMCATIVLRILCVAALSPAVAFAGLIAAHTLGRGAAVGVMGTVRSVPEDGLGADYTRTLARSSPVVGVLAALVITTVATGWWVAPLALAAGIGATVVTWVAQRAFGGISGDILGAVEQVGECLVLIVVTGLALRHQLWWT
ncbi:MAG TPA: adenosylcobinamide-GDP ribazoletransferase [Ilumatobacteraceae bacterium]|nr:adenosylcobinamide-GDP ribazoletransferase [Ilumatobacteraceae bacterium]